MTLSWRPDRTLFRSRLGRRIFLMFCLAAIVPAAAVFWLTYRTAVQNAGVASQAAMRAENKYFGLGVMERLETADTLLGRVSVDGRAGVVHQALLDPYFAQVELLDLPLRAQPSPASLEAELAGLPGWRMGSPKLVVLPAVGGHSPRIVLVSRRSFERRARVVVGVVRQAYLWGDPEDLALHGQICVVAATRKLTCVGETVLRDSAEEPLRDEWELFMRARFAADSWKFIATRAPEPLLASHLYFLVPLAVGLLLLVLLLSSVELRRILVPLESLLARIRALSGTTQAEPAPSADDELGRLTQTFGDMELRIKRQMGTLRTLSELDQMILDRVPVHQVIDVVLARIQGIVDVAAVGVTLEFARSGVVQHFERRRGLDGPVREGSDALAQLPWDADGSRDVGPKWTRTDVGPDLERLGATHALVLPLAGRQELLAWITLGCLADELPSEVALAEVQEVAERISVAMAVEEHENVLVFQARHDTLTGLPNRLAAVEALGQSIDQARDGGPGFAVVFIDLDRFKSINDGLGHAQGDDILIRAGERIRSSIGTDDFVARFGGDEFFVILRSCTTPGQASRATANVSAAFGTAILTQGLELLIGFSAGIAVYPQHGTEADELIHNADLAMYRGKKAGGGSVSFFEEEMNETAVSRVQLENDLRQAIRGGELHLHYQPRVDSRNGRIVGAEALARWTHPTKGNIPPDVFIALAEECGLIEELGGFVIAEACRQLGAWRRLGLRLPLMAINVSSHQLRTGKLTTVLAEAVGRGGVDHSDIEIEVTESLLINDVGAAAQQLQAVRMEGGTVALDDFGTGYSSLAYLANLPIDTIKIDRAFVEKLGDGASAAVVRSIIALANALQKSLVAEGVESMDNVELLGGWGCHVIQGYVFHRPLTAEAMQRLLAEAEVPTAH